MIPVLYTGSVHAGTAAVRVVLYRTDSRLGYGTLARTVKLVSLPLALPVAVVVLVVLL